MQNKSGHLASDLADSTMIKLLSPLVLAVMIPATGWFGNKMFDRLDKLDAAIALSTTTTATNDYRLRQLEASLIKLEAENKGLRDDVSKLILRIEVMDVRNRR